MFKSGYKKEFDGASFLEIFQVKNPSSLAAPVCPCGLIMLSTYRGMELGQAFVEISCIDWKIFD